VIIEHRIREWETGRSFKARFFLAANHVSQFTASNPPLCQVISNRELTMRRASASRASAPRRTTRGVCSALSNREPRLLEPSLTHRKQTVAPRSNRELSTNQCSCNSRLTGASFPDVLPCRAQYLAGFPRASFAKGSICSGALLPGSGSQVEIAVTHSKQSTDEFLPGSRIAQLETRICAKMNAQISSQLSAQMSQIR
jgi:hypothetical protein